MQLVRLLNQVSHELTCPRSSNVYISPSLGYLLFSYPSFVDDLLKNHNSSIMTAALLSLKKLLR
jgi:hypothetical protein